MAVLDNVQSVAKYESKLLMRSWFYRIFLILALLILCFFNFVCLVNPEMGEFWMMRALPSNIPYINLLLLNTGQAVIAVFLSSEFLKSDKKLDTSEVFYVHPLSNAEYVIGKIWGNMNVFFRLNLIIIFLVVVFNFVSGIAIDWGSYITYFFIISVPTLIYIFGLSIGCMLIFKNQAITFVLLLGYIALTLFYISDKFYYLFDYMMYNLPLVKSSIVGYTNWSTLVNHRLIYLLLGLGFICISIFLFRRLPNTKYGRYSWLAVSFCFIFAGLFAGYKHVNMFLASSNMRAKYIEINNKYVNTPQMVIRDYDINLEHRLTSISATVAMNGTAQETSSVFTFCLNPFLVVREIKENGKDLSFTRDHQIISVDFGRILEPGDTTTCVFTYDGRIDEDFCYLDIPDDLLQAKHSAELFNIDKKYSFQTENYVLFTPETYWYPRPGVAFSSENPDWQSVFFSNYHLTVKTINGLQALSQGTRLSPLEKVPTIRSNEYDSNDGTIRPVGGMRGGGDRGFFMGGGGPMGGFGGGGRGGGGPQPVQRQQMQGGQGGPQGPGGQGGQQGQRNQGVNNRQPIQDNQTGNAGQQRQSQNTQGRDSIQQVVQRDAELRAQGSNPDSVTTTRMRDGGGEFRAQRGDQGSEMRERIPIDPETRERMQNDPEFRERMRDSMMRVREAGGAGFRGQGSRDGDSSRIISEGIAATPVDVPVDSIFIYKTDFPTPAISLIIGDYEQKSIEVDRAIYSLWHLKSNDFFSASFNEVLDTIPYQIRLRRQTFENNYTLNYSFKRFSIIEVPVQFSSYVRTWTQAQEVIQPEMVLFPEKGCMFNNLDVLRQIPRQKSFAKRMGREITDREAAINVFNNFLMTFQRSEGSREFTMERGTANISIKP
ncbi:MAG: ABC transporter permease, partial [Tannerella sp.]|nr:ABC transporter permease [Tannerella sp.]